jgi:hypothetical protein
VVTFSNFDTAFCMCTDLSFENAVLEVFFPIFITELNDHLRPTLSDEERRILKLVKVNLEYDGTNNYNINSESVTRTVTISSNLIKGLVRYSVAQVIGEDELHFNRRRFGEFYLSVYPYLAPYVSPEDTAELTKEKKAVLDRICRTPDFQWFFKQKLQFL